jgi:hypothetical protein
VHDHRRDRERDCGRDRDHKRERRVSSNGPSGDRRDSRSPRSGRDVSLIVQPVRVVMSTTLCVVTVRCTTL